MKHAESYVQTPEAARTNVVATHHRFARAPVQQALVLLTKRQIAAQLGVSTRTIDRWSDSEDGRGLPYRQVVNRRRYSLADVLEWTESTGKEHL